MHAEAANELLARNREYAERHADGDIPAPPALKVAVVTCMDCRIDIYSALGLEPGEAHVIRNAGGSAQDALRSLVVSQRKLGTREVVLITHTSCGMASFDAGEFQTELGDEARSIDFDTFESPERAAADGADFLAAHPLILPGTAISSFVYDVRTGTLEPVKATARPQVV